MEIETEEAEVDRIPEVEVIPEIDIEEGRDLQVIPEAEVEVPQDVLRMETSNYYLIQPIT
jgi:hypothetical protein